MRVSGVQHPLIEFAGAFTAVDRTPFTIGRAADLVLDQDNHHLHRRFITIDRRESAWILGNCGTHLVARLTDADERLDIMLRPSAELPLSFGEATVRFVAGHTAYEFTIRFDDLAADSSTAPSRPPEFDDEPTVGRPTLTPEQHQLLLALAEATLVGTNRSAMPTSAQLARRLGWTLTKFNRKLDNVCLKLGRHGIGGLHGAPGMLASDRRVRLVEYALGVGLVRRADLDLLPGAKSSHVTGPSAVA